MRVPDGRWKLNCDAAVEGDNALASGGDCRWTDTCYLIIRDDPNYDAGHNNDNASHNKVGSGGGARNGQVQKNYASVSRMT